MNREGKGSCVTVKREGVFQFPEKIRSEMENKYGAYLSRFGKAKESIKAKAVVPAKKDIITVELSDSSDDEEVVAQPIPITTLARRPEREPETEPGASTSDGTVAQMILKMTKEVRQQYDSQATQDKEEIQKLQELVQLLELKVEEVTLEKQNIQQLYESSQLSKDTEIQNLEELVHMLKSNLDMVTLEREDLGKKLKKERSVNKLMNARLRVAGQELHQVNSILRGFESLELSDPPTTQQQADHNPPPPSPSISQVDPDPHPVEDSQIAREEYSFTAVKLEPQQIAYTFYGNREREYRETDQVLRMPLSFANDDEDHADDNHDSVPVVLAKVTRIAPPPPSSLFNHSVYSQKLIRKYKKAINASRSAAKPKPPPKPKKSKPKRGRKEAKTKEPRKKSAKLSQGVHSVVYGSKRDRTLFGLRESGVPRKPFEPPKPKARKQRQQRPSTSSGGDGPDIGKGMAPPPPKRPRLFRQQETASGSNHIVDESKPGHHCCCGYSFPTNYLLNRHVTYFGDWKFKCEDCGKPFVSTHTLRKHLIAAHEKTLPEGVCGCTKCGGIFASHKEFIRHRKAKECPGYM